ncbi:MAG: radical SAM protein [Thermodesulfovibrionia bacterium]|nr:radical SAM protein [Thermodesulfovibrionia bacterium]
MKKKLILINPVGQKSGLLLSKFSAYPPLSLAYVAALTPDYWDVEIIDENMEEFSYKEADLVGITSFTANINRAYEIAGIYRSKGIKVILGGIHASMLPDEAVNYVDSVVVGEAELIWQKVIEDFENNVLKQKYHGPVVSLRDYHILPRRDLLSNKYLWGTIQTSRGCPFGCDFCSVSRYLGKDYRQKKTEDILDELEKIENKYIIFLDDNLVGYGKSSEENAIKLFKGMLKRNIKKKWCMQTSINTGENEEVLKYAAKSGCIYALVGIETISKESLKDMKKGINLKIGIDNFKNIIGKFHKYGIGVLGAFILGNDYENAKYFKELSDFIVRAGVDVAQITILTPLPGTSLFDRLQSEGRLKHTNFPDDWVKYRFSHLVHEPKGINEKELYKGNNYIKSRIYSPYGFFFRMVRTLFSLKRFDSFMAIYHLNKAFKKGWQNSHYYNMP